MSINQKEKQLIGHGQLLEINIEDNVKDEDDTDETVSFKTSCKQLDEEDSTEDAELVEIPGEDGTYV